MIRGRTLEEAEMSKQLTELYNTAPDRIEEALAGQEFAGEALHINVEALRNLGTYLYQLGVTETLEVLGRIGNE